MRKWAVGLCLLKTALAAETLAFRTGTGYRPRHVRDRLSSPPFSTPRQLPWARRIATVTMPPESKNALISLP
jgi:hypothetical protein